MCHVVKRRNANQAAGRNQNQKRGTTSVMARFLATAALCPTRSVARTRSRLFKFTIIEEHNCGGAHAGTRYANGNALVSRSSRGIPSARSPVAPDLSAIAEITRGASRVLRTALREI